MKILPYYFPSFEGVYGINAWIFYLENFQLLLRLVILLLIELFD
ncbi:hypothetical protein A1OE_1029 [Candidatus Endolissoclinum faulkneri L2]|uniref:Uncharacterized protein n=1 Tax=Candidatus Endolissoclinum faulkneri L2 TaxID=1193729 RepID=K7Z579_9PROT|nr:hypothetical protein A1OE_1029 [Candidatus Endolissoclinum faulkneri L2]